MEPTFEPKGRQPIKIGNDRATKKLCCLQVRVGKTQRQVALSFPLPKWVENTRNYVGRKMRATERERPAHDPHWSPTYLPPLATIPRDHSTSR